ncbi:hypothetical protein NL676_005573 [Syzygium grande]|nr:hypothetical protein NL676_005573 [Syzygium grande]
MSLEPQSPDLNQTDWVVYVVTERLKRVPLNEGQTWKKRCVYQVPAFDADLNRRAYQPQVVSFGPYHHGEDHLRPMEEHKHRALLHFLEQSKKPLRAFLESLREVSWDLEECYDELDPKWKDGGGEGAAGRFLELMFTDGCFMLEILRTATQAVDDYVPDDPIFSNHGKFYIMQYIRRDMLMLENQLPMLVLDRLVAVESDGEKDIEFINRLILNFCSPGTSITRMGNCPHVLDVFRKSMLMKPKMKVQHELGNTGHDEGEKIIRSVTELDEAGIRFKKSTRPTALRTSPFPTGS